ncbi:MAG: glycosyltransferase [Ramlibacter sp.]|nr:glycosyltransferase [Ramlibacter sp.]
MNTVRDRIPEMPTSTQAPQGAADRNQPIRLSCVIPCRNEANNLDLLLPQLCELLPRLAQAWEVILVDDGSTDHTATVMRDWSELPGFRVLQLSRNFGKEAALTAGLEAAAGDVVVMMDADLQHPPALVSEMLAHWRHGADVVYAVRQSRSDEPLFKRVGTRLFYQLLNRFDKVKVPEGAGDFRLLDRGAVDALLALPERNRFMKGLYAWIGFQSVGVPYMPQPRAHGRTHFSLTKLLGLSIDGLTAFANWPLRIVGALGILLALAAFAYGGYLTLVYMLYGHQVSGWTTIVVTLMLFFGMQMIFLGIIGEYVARIFQEVKGRPLYLVKRKLGRGLEPLAP